jgi:hypothetical protein
VGRPALVSDARGRAFPIDLRRVDATPVSTDELPDTPTRDRSIPATAWREAPPALLALGEGLGEPGRADPAPVYLRRIGPWLLWRAGPPVGGRTRYLAIAAEHPGRTWGFALEPDGSATGAGPDGVVHTRFRTWKEALRDHPEAAAPAQPGAGSGLAPSASGDVPSPPQLP